MNVASKQFFARPGLATNEDGYATFGSLLRDFHCLANRGIVTDKIRVNDDLAAARAVLAREIDSGQHLVRKPQIRSEKVIGTTASIGYLT